MTEPSNLDIATSVGRIDGKLDTLAASQAAHALSVENKFNKLFDYTETKYDKLDERMGSVEKKLNFAAGGGFMIGILVSGLFYVLSIFNGLFTWKT